MSQRRIARDVYGKRPSAKVAETSKPVSGHASECRGIQAGRGFGEYDAAANFVVAMFADSKQAQQVVLVHPVRTEEIDRSHQESETSRAHTSGQRLHMQL
jgi:hypothetical protein